MGKPRSRESILGAGAFAFLASALLVLVPASPASAMADDGICNLPLHEDGFGVGDIDDLKTWRDDESVDCSDETIYQTASFNLDGWDEPITDWFGTFDGNGFELNDAGSAQAPLFNDPSGDVHIIRVIRHADTEGGSSVGAFIGYTDEVTTITDSHSTGGTAAAGREVGGLVGYADGPTTVTNSYVTGDVVGDGVGDIGGLIGFVTGAATISGSYTTGSVTGNASVGGLIGATDSGAVSILDSYSTGAVSGGDYVGGLIGFSWKVIDITDSFSIGPVHGDDYYVGGMIGYADDAVDISTSYTMGLVQGSQLVGGMVGYTDSSLNVSEVFLMGAVEGDNYVGGVVGYSDGEIDITDSYTRGSLTASGDTAGGFVGYSHETLTITNSYTTSDVNTDNYNGGFIGDAGDVDVFASYCLASAVNCLSGTGDVSATADELKSSAFLADTNLWNFTDTWCFEESLNDGYPVLRAIDFGPGDTDNCETPPAGGARTTNPSRFTVVLDPTGGTCLGHDYVWTVRFTGSYSLPTASECSRDGFTFLGWASDPSSNVADDIVSGDIDRSASLRAVWTALTPVPLSLTSLANFNCETCDSVLLLWPIGPSSPDSDRVSIDASDVQCAGAGTIATIRWCWVTGLSNSSDHSASVIRSTSAGPISAVASFSLRGGPPPRLPVTA